MYSYFSRCHVTTNSVAPPPLYKLHTTHNSSIRSDETMLETSAFRIRVWWSIYIINSVDKTKFLHITCTCLLSLAYFYRLDVVIQQIKMYNVLQIIHAYTVIFPRTFIGRTFYLMRSTYLILIFVHFACPFFVRSATDIFCHQNNR